MTTSTEAVPPPMDPLTEAEIADLARKVVTNVVFLANSPEAVEMSFGMILMLGGASKVPPNACAFYEDYEKAGSRSINGWPMFFSCHMVPAESWDALWAEMQRMRVALGLEPFPERPVDSDGQNGGHGDNRPGADLPHGR